MLTAIPPTLYHTLTTIEAIAQRFADEAAEPLRAAGLKVTPQVRSGDAKRELLAAAQQCNADCIFVGARGLSRIERFVLGSVSIAVATRAHCSVEVVHVPTGT